ncbi:MAG: hypothetical protein JNL13_09425 [Chitinophagaceae bacterium]|nr:hypothetical protein [Chitinophagaceae bacterium]
MKQIILIVTIALFGLQVQAQGDGSGRVRTMRVNYITERLHLPPDQNARFWAVYNRYMDERSALRGTYKNQFRSNGKAHMNQYAANRFVDDNIEYKEKDLELSKKYKDELLKVISAEQLADVYQAERDFKKMLIETLKDK